MQKLEELTSCECIFEHLLKAQELEDAEIDAGMEPKSAFVRTKSGIELDTKSTVHMELALVIFPGDSELNYTLWDCGDFESLLVFRILFEEGAVF